MGRDINKLHPELIPICQEFVKQCKAAGLNVLVTDTFRTKQDQTLLYAQGRTRKGSVVTNCRYPDSPHNWGVAFDFCRNVRGREYDNSDNFFERCGAIGKKLGLTWGGDWKRFVDKPHLELTKFMPNSSCSWLKRTYGTPENFMKTWEEDDMTEAEVKKIVVEAIDEYFADLAKKPANWEASVMQKAKVKKTKAGKSVMDGTRPKSPVTRGELAQVLENIGALD